MYQHRLHKAQKSKLQIQEPLNTMAAVRLPPCTSKNAHKMRPLISWLEESAFYLSFFLNVLKVWIGIHLGILSRSSWVSWWKKGKMTAVVIFWGPAPATLLSEFRHMATQEIAFLVMELPPQGDLSTSFNRCLWSVGEYFFISSSVPSRNSPFCPVLNFWLCVFIYYFYYIEVTKKKLIQPLRLAATISSCPQMTGILFWLLRS